MKLKGDPPVEKYILRKAFEDLLPDEILWRKKEQFDEGSGTVDLLKGLLHDVGATDDIGAYRDRCDGLDLRSQEECYYHNLFMDVFEDPEPILGNVARWAQRPDWNEVAH